MENNCNSSGNVKVVRVKKQYADRYNGEVFEQDRDNVTKNLVTIRTGSSGKKNWWKNGKMTIGEPV